MTTEQRAIYWAGASIALLALLWLLSDVLTPFLFGAVIAYFLDPAADRFEEWGLSRALATAVVTLIAVLIFVAALLLIVPPLIDEIDRVIRAAPALLDDLRRMLNTRLSFDIPANDVLPMDATGAQYRENGVNEELRGAAKNIGVGALKGLWSGGTALVSGVGMIAAAAIVAFYLLLDWDRMIARIDGWLPRHRADELRELARQIDSVLAGFLRGQMLVCVILGTFYAVALSVLGLKFGLLVGIVSGVLCFIPLVGSFIGLILSTGLAVSQFWGDWVMIGAVAGVFVFGQLVEGNILTPYLVGGSVGLHPVWLIFALSAFGSLFGFAGLVLAVPVAAVIGVLARRAIERYKNSPLYLGGNG